ncbi:hypothetical protein L9F63_019296 [Diploptera punctata]|uniref:Uncharacterized protein n=1 Tax=Diploptera punctata TaxID=6984 RepID=A0AAD7ZWP1_DIPPU|nr:hypothetical protein L9F63_019296 [Diploptera punctata]
MGTFTFFGLVINVVLLTSELCLSAPKYETSGGFVPITYYQQSVDQVAMESQQKNHTTAIQERSVEATNSTDDRQQRFGFLTYGTTAVQDTGNTGLTGLNGQLKLDLGAVFILPKILHVFSADHGQESGFSGGHYGYRSEDVKRNSTNIVDVLSRIDDTLSKYHIDSSSCMQRAVCYYVKSSTEKVSEGSGNSLDATIDTVAENSVVNSMLDGTSIKQAMDTGRSGGDCGTSFARCAFNKESVFAALRDLLDDKQ